MIGRGGATERERERESKTSQLQQYCVHTRAVLASIHNLVRTCAKRFFAPLL